MNKYFILATGLILLNCSEKAPDCNDEFITKNVIEMTTIEKKTNMSDLRRKIYNEIYPDNPIYASESNFGLLGNDESKRDVENYTKLGEYIDGYVKGDSTKIPVEILSVIGKYGSKINPIYTPKLKNIRIAEKNDELKSCGCNGDLEYEENTSHNKSIYFTAQENTDGETYVEVFETNQ